MDAVIQKAYDLASKGFCKVNATFKNGNKAALRLFISTGDLVCYKRKGSRRRGYYLGELDLIDVQPITKKKSIDKRWQDAWKKVKARLVASGLWVDIVAEIDIALSAGYDRMKQAYEDYWKDFHSDTDGFAKKYPEMVYKNDEGIICINTHLVWNISSIPKVKKMRFHKGSMNNSVLQAIQKAMDEKREFTADGRTAYDVDFSYRPDKNKAFYSEQFKGMGNGHYYIALDSTHALFMEDD